MGINDITVFLTKLDPHIEEWAAITSWSEGAVWMLVVGLAIAVVAFPLLIFRGHRHHAKRKQEPLSRVRGHRERGGSALLPVDGPWIPMGG